MTAGLRLSRSQTPIPERVCRPRRLNPARGFFVTNVFLIRSCARAIVKAMPRDCATLADLRSPTLTIVCEPCGRRGRYSVARLLAQHGDAKLPDLLATLADCKRARDGGIYDRCKAVYGADKAATAEAISPRVYVSCDQHGSDQGHTQNRAPRRGPHRVPTERDREHEEHKGRNADDA